MTWKPVYVFVYSAHINRLIIWIQWIDDAFLVSDLNDWWSHIVCIEIDIERVVDIEHIEFIEFNWHQWTSAGIECIESIESEFI